MIFVRCDGGYIDKAWKYAMNKGLCTGGPYATKNVCKAYPFHPCGKHKDQPYYGECTKRNQDTPVCKQTCDAGYTKKYEEDKVYAKSAYDIQPSEAAIQKEIMINGPVQAGFVVYTDFMYYKKGIYKVGDFCALFFET
ncbi:papain family cysteine protease [Oesophagostomum dentatum]|uniref:Papain family cysteine protease n=1 Tax=Oesophagostomum dentatum TaxID=61180 RepID=A0A0B1S7B5_OESDE|nr:papain family cysteine protease [Oesophagostomum dentatum]